MKKNKLMSSEAEIKALIETSNIGKQLKEELNAFGSQNDNELNTLQAVVLRLKVEVNEFDRLYLKS